MEIWNKCSGPFLFTVLLSGATVFLFMSLDLVLFFRLCFPSVRLLLGQNIGPNFQIPAQPWVWLGGRDRFFCPVPSVVNLSSPCMK